MTRHTERRRLTQAAIFDAAVALFDERGYDATSVEDVCSAAGVGRATFFRYYETKTGLIREVDVRVAADVRSQLGLDVGRHAVSNDIGLPELLRAIGDGLFAMWADASAGMLAIGRESGSIARPSRRVFAQTLEVAIGVITAVRERGELHSPLPPQLIGYTVLMQLTGAVAWWIDTPDADLRGLLDGTIEHCLQGYHPAPYAALIPATARS
ncbi:TetR/AcrR family transcriptional regulator [Cumulibacter soli]|uniref:TetR/AcrR family transcriptional regulator n=1 Tax=Cumulibacter soli TaxID=2546344 RepID=UPI00106783BD|nr:TetR/AcrR family transcriptional regulator [Cumulibacter soli]